MIHGTKEARTISMQLRTSLIRLVNSDKTENLKTIVALLETLVAKTCLIKAVLALKEYNSEEVAKTSKKNCTEVFTLMVDIIAYTCIY